MFHAHDGWFFERLADGAVRVVKRATASFDAPIVVEGVFRADAINNEWASIVASVSLGGEEGYRFFAAEKFHNSSGMVDVYEGNPLQQKLAP